jgi:hypothetical protein
VDAQQAAQGMNRWTRTNLLLAVLVAALLAAHLWPAGSTEHPPLTGLDEAEITSVRVERSDRLRLALQRDDKAWQLTHPQQAPAQTQRVRQLLAIAGAPVQQAFPATGDLARYGLATPGAVLQLNNLRLLFGDRDPSQTSRYILVNDKISVIDDVYFNLLSLPPSHFTGD